MYVNLMVTTKQKRIVNTQKKMRMGSKHNTRESSQTTREERKRRKEQRETTTTARKQQNGSKYTPIGNYFKCKWNKFSNQKPWRG